MLGHCRCTWIVVALGEEQDGWSKDGPEWQICGLLQRIMGVKYSFPTNLRLSQECLDLIRQIFVANPAKRVTLKGLKQHPWFLQNLPDELKVRTSEYCH